MEIRSSEKVVLSLSVVASLVYWGWTWWRNQNGTDVKQVSNRRNPNIFHMVRSPGSPRTRDAHKNRGCTCKMISTKDDCQEVGNIKT